MKITYKDWAEVLEKAFSAPSDDGFQSSRQLTAATGLGEDALKRRLNRGIDAGYIIPHKAPRKGRCGLVQPIVVYEMDKDSFRRLLKNENTAK